MCPGQQAGKGKPEGETESKEVKEEGSEKTMIEYVWAEMEEEGRDWRRR